VSGGVDVASFESDPRFVSLCQTLGKSPSPKGPPGKKSPPKKQDDLSVVLGVTGDDEAAKLISTITVPQMIKVLSSLTSKKRRSLPLLRSLAFNISKESESLDVKQCADVLFALACLNFPDELLLEKVTSDLIRCIPECQKSSVIGSICTSLGILRYKDYDLLQTLSEWAIKNVDICRGHDLTSVLMTFASVNFTPSSQEDFVARVLPALEKQETTSSSSWLDIVWSLVILKWATPRHMESVLNDKFIERLRSLHPEGLPYQCKKKLLNVNGMARWTKGYRGCLLEGEAMGEVSLLRSKEKQLFVNSVFDALSNLLPSQSYLMTNIDSGMGFLIDGECLIDKKMTPLMVVDKKTGQPLNNKPTKGIRIAVMVWDYHSMTRGRVDLSGGCKLCEELTAMSGYKVLSVPFSEFNPKDKLSSRVKFLETHLKLLVQTPS